MCRGVSAFFLFTPKQGFQASGEADFSFSAGDKREKRSTDKPRPVSLTVICG